MSFASKFKLSKSLVMSILLYNCKTWTWSTDFEKMIQVFKTKHMGKFILLSFSENKTNNWVRSSINFLNCQETETHKVQAYHAL